MAVSFIYLRCVLVFTFFVVLQAMSSGEVVGAIVCKLDVHKKVTVRGYIAMLAVDHRFRKRRIGKHLHHIIT